MSSVLGLSEGVVYAGKDACPVKENHYRPADSEYDAGKSAREIVWKVAGVGVVVPAPRSLQDSRSIGV